jgi:WD40 repeat protein
LWNLPDGRLLRTIQPNDPTDVARMFFSPDGRTLATITAFSNWLRLWDVASGRLLGQPAHVEESLNRVTAGFSRKGAFVALVQMDAIALRDLIPENWIKAICRTVNRNLTMEEWKDYVGSSDYQPPCPELQTPK